MALLRGRGIPIEAIDAYTILETGCYLTASDLDAMTVKEVQHIVGLRHVADVIKNGGELKL